MSMPLQNMDDLRRRSQLAGEDFFEKTGSDFLCTRVETYLIGHQYFITSELVTGDESGREDRSSRAPGVHHSMSCPRARGKRLVSHVLVVGVAC